MEMPFLERQLCGSAGPREDHRLGECYLTYHLIILFFLLKV